MFRRGKVQPSVDQYISRRYDDTAVVIYQELRSGRALRNWYVTWLEGQLEGLPEEQRKRYSLLRTPSPSPAAWRSGGETGRASERDGQEPKSESEGQQVVQRSTANSSKFCNIL